MASPYGGSSSIPGAGLPQPPHQPPPSSQAPTQPQANPEIYVRRLFKPRLYDQVSIGEDLGAQLGSLNKRMSSGGNGSTAPPPSSTVLAAEVVQSDFLLQPALALPEEFGKIYLGETFCAYVSIVNTLSFPILLLDAQASLKSSRSSEVLLQNMAATRQAAADVPIPPMPPPGQGGLGITRDRPRELRPGQNLDVVVEHVLQELDWHYLAIKLEFVDSLSGGVEAPRPMMKRFKFKVYNPVALTTTQRPLPSGEVLLQAQVKNITERHTSLLLEDVTFVAEDGLVAETVDVAGKSKEEEDDTDADPLDCVAAFDRHVYLQPEDVVQYLYRLTRDESQGGGMLLAAGAPLGQLRVSWRTTLGEAGTLLSPRVLCSNDTATTTRPVELRLERPLVPLSSSSLSSSPLPQSNEDDDPHADGTLVQGQVYAAHCRLHNNTDKDLWLQVQFHLELMQGVYVTAKAFQNAGLVPARTTKPLTFQLLPLMAGLHDVKGVTIMDMTTSQEYEQHRLCEVMVVRGKAGQEASAGGAGAGIDHVLAGSN